MRKPKETKKSFQKRLDAEIQKLYNETCNRVQFNIMDLGNVTKEAKNLLTDGHTIEEARDAMIKGRERYRQN